MAGNFHGASILGNLKLDEFTDALKLLWERSQVPFNREILRQYSGLGDRKLDKYLTALVKAGVLGVDADDGEVQWTVRGSGRDLAGPETIERFERLQRLRAEAKAKVAREAENRKRRRAGLDEVAAPSDAADPESEPPKASDRSDGDDDDGGGGGRSIIRAGAGVAKGALGLVAAAAAPLDGRKATSEKSLALSAGLSLLGPLGWLYAGSFREAIPASLLYLGLAAIIPNALLWPILWFALPVSSLAGLAYAWQHNRKGQRSALFLGGDKKKKKKD